MKASELRKGNLIYVLNEIREIDCCDIFMIDNEHELHKDIKPIPLTEEWLLKFGFEDSIINKNSLINCYEFDLKNKCIYLLLDYKNHRITIARGINYIHQLQNLYYALTGEELTLKQ